MECCAGTISLAKDCILLSHHRLFTGCDLNVVYVASNLSQLILIFACQALNEESATTEDDDVQRAAFIFVKGMEEVDLNCHIDVWETPKGFSILQTFPLLML